LNGVEFNESTISLSQGDVFSGTLEDGSTFILNDQRGSGENDSISNLVLSEVTLPEFAPSVVVDTPSQNLTARLRSGQTLTLRDGGVLGDSFESADAILNVEGGALGDSATIAQGTLNLSGGTIGDGFLAVSDSTLNISGGRIGVQLNAVKSDVNISGGSIGNSFAAEQSEVNITGGNVGNSFTASDREALEMALMLTATAQ